MAVGTYEEGKKVGMDVGYSDGKSGKDSKNSFEPTLYSEEYAKGWYDGYDYGLKLGKRAKKNLRD